MLLITNIIYNVDVHNVTKGVCLINNKICLSFWKGKGKR